MTAMKLTEKQRDILDNWYNMNFGHVRQTTLSDSDVIKLAKQSKLEQRNVREYIKLRRSYDKKGKCYTVCRMVMIDS